MEKFVLYEAMHSLRLVLVVEGWAANIQLTAAFRKAPVVSNKAVCRLLQEPLARRARSTTK